MRHYQRRDSVPRILGPGSLPVPRTKTSHDTSQITTLQTRTSHFTHTLFYPDTSDPGDFRPRTRRTQYDGAELSGHFVPSAEVSYGHFSTGPICTLRTS